MVADIVYVKSQHINYKSPSKGRSQGQVTHINFWGPQWYLWNGWSESRQILYVCRIYQVLALGWQITYSGRGRGHVTRF